MEISVPDPRLISSPADASVSAALTKPSTVSVTYVKSRAGARFPSTISSCTSACEMIVGMIARSDWRGPYVLKGRRTATGSPNAYWKLSPSASAPILLAD